MAKQSEKSIAVGVFLSAADLSPKYTKPAVKFGALLVQNGYRFVYGGSERGLMKVVADIVDETGGEIVAVTTELFKDVCRENVSEAILTSSIAERKSMMLAKSDAIVTLSGGTGTLDEVTEIIELRKNNLHDKPVVFMNVGGFWNGLQKQLKKMEKEGFLFKPLDQLVYFAESPQDAIDYLNDHFTKNERTTSEEAKQVVVVAPGKAG
jgi:uncharacterized protein (TIGR00730 family)